MLVLLAVVCIAVATADDAGMWCGNSCSSLALLTEMATPQYNWSSNPITTEAAALASGDYVPQNNVITGVSAYQDRVFLCVPRWRSGVPSTLNELSFDPQNGTAVLNPFPSWSWNTDILHYVQAIFVDQARGTMYIIDTGRENFFNSDAMLTTINRAASLYVISIPVAGSEAVTVLYNVTFPDEILPFNSSFLNDIRAHPAYPERVFMTDTNVAGRGAIIVADLKTGFQRRLEAQQTFAQSGFVVVVSGTAYPTIQNPVDGIAISPDGSLLYFSCVDGSNIFAVPTNALLSASTSEADVAALITTVYNKGTGSDGMDVAVVNGVASIIYGGLSSDSLMRLDLTSDGLLESAPPAALSRSKPWLQWQDTIVAVGDTVYFTSNRLQQYFFYTMDISGRNGPNMRVWKMQLGSAVCAVASTSVPAWAVAVMTVMFGVSLVLGVFVVSTLTARGASMPGATPLMESE